MRERPILFSGEMVRAILAGWKTMTRRPMKPQPPASAEEVFCWYEPQYRLADKSEEGCYYRDSDGLKFLRRCPYGAPGDRLWVREPHQFLRMDDGNTICAYRASCEGDSLTYASPGRSTVEAVQVARWRPAIHMPRDASRLTLEVTGVRVERLTAITGDDAHAEGFADGAAFVEAWRAMYPDGPLNPWVWVVEFRRLP